MKNLKYFITFLTGITVALIFVSSCGDAGVGMSSLMKNHKNIFENLCVSSFL
jgi:hypothetical protein